MNLKSKVRKDLIRYIPQIIVPAFMAFISIPIYTRVFTPSAYGNLAIVKVSGDILTRFSAWLVASMTRYYNVYDRNKNLDAMITTMIKTAIIISVIISCIMLLLLGAVNISSQLKILFCIGAILFPLTMIKRLLTNILRLQRRIITHSFYAVLYTIGSFIVILIFIFFYHMNVEAILLSNTILLLLILPFLWKNSAHKKFKCRIKIDSEIVRKSALYGIPLVIGNLGYWLLDVSDRYMIGLLQNTHVLGIYASCYNVTWNSLFLIVNLFFLMEEPLAMRSYVNNGKEELEEFLGLCTRVYLLVIIPCVFMMCFYADYIFRIMVGAEFRDGIRIVPYIALSVLFSGIIYKFRLGMLVMERTKSLMVIVLASGGANILLNFLLLPKYGIVGAGVATFSSYSLYLLLILFVSRKVLRWPFPIISSVKILLSGCMGTYGIAPIIKMVNIRDRYGMLAICFIMSLVVYVSALIIFKEIKLGNVSGILGIAKKTMRLG